MYSLTISNATRVMPAYVIPFVENTQKVELNRKSGREGKALVENNYNTQYLVGVFSFLRSSFRLHFLHHTIRILQQ